MAPGVHLGDGLAWLHEQPADSLDGIFTDPPWGTGPAIAGQAEWLVLAGSLLQAAERVVRPAGHTMVWFGQAQWDTVCRQVLPDVGLYLNAFLVVDYVPKRFVAQYATLDMVGVFSRTRFAPPRSDPFCWPIYRAVSTGWHDSSHPCYRPPAVVESILRSWFRPGDRIADPFAGSDTTGWAARRLGLDCWSWEIDPLMYEAARERHAQGDLFLEAVAV